MLSLPLSISVMFLILFSQSQYYGHFLEYCYSKRFPLLSIQTECITVSVMRMQHGWKGREAKCKGIERQVVMGGKIGKKETEKWWWEDKWKGGGWVGLGARKREKRYQRIKKRRKQWDIEAQPYWFGLSVFQGGGANLQPPRGSNIRWEEGLLSGICMEIACYDPSTLSVNICNCVVCSHPPLCCSVAIAPSSKPLDGLAHKPQFYPWGCWGAQPKYHLKYTKTELLCKWSDTGHAHACCHTLSPLGTTSPIGPARPISRECVWPRASAAVCIDGSKIQPRVGTRLPGTRATQGNFGSRVGLLSHIMVNPGIYECMQTKLEETGVPQMS